MHSTKVTNFPFSATPFASVTITVGDDHHISTSMSERGTSDVTMFFNSLEEVSQFATDILNHVIDQTCTSTDPTEHQGNTCPVHEAAEASPKTPAELANLQGGG